MARVGLCTQYPLADARTTSSHLLEEKTGFIRKVPVMAGSGVGVAILFTNGTTVLQRADAHLQNARDIQGPSWQQPLHREVILALSLLNGRRQAMNS